MPDNELRQAVNKARFESACKSLAVASAVEGDRASWNKELPIMILAEVWTRRPRGKLAIDRADPAICNFVWHHVPDDIFDDKCGSLPIILGSPYRITDNLALSVGVAKNIIVSIKDIRIDRPHINVTWDARFNCHVVSRQGPEHHCQSEHRQLGRARAVHRPTARQHTSAALVGLRQASSEELENRSDQMPYVFPDERVGFVMSSLSRTIS